LAESADTWSTYIRHTASDIYYVASPTIGSFAVSDLSWWQTATRPDALHAMATWGYYTHKGGGVYVWDSAYNRSVELTVTNGGSQAFTHAGGGVAW
jgi:hypothetical protein